MQGPEPTGPDRTAGGHYPSGDLPVDTGGHPPAETLAAYIDGELGRVEAERVTAHLADCEDCYTVYSDSLRFLLEAGSEGGEGTVVPFRPRPLSKPDRQPWLQIAALLVVGLGTGAYFQLLHTPPALKTADITKPIPSRAEVVEEVWTGPIYRGGEGEPEVKLNEAAFRTGVQLVNLQVSLKAGKTVEAQNAIAAIHQLLDAGFVTEDLKKKYAGLTSSLEDAPQPSAFLPEAAKLAEETREVFDEGSLDFGQWVEAGRLAAAAGDPRFFQQGATRSFLRRVIWREKVGHVIWTPWEDLNLSEVTRQSLQEVYEVTFKGNLQPSDYSKLTDALERVLEEHYPET